MNQLAQETYSQIFSPISSQQTFNFRWDRSMRPDEKYQNIMKRKALQILDMNSYYDQFSSLNNEVASDKSDSSDPSQNEIPFSYNNNNNNNNNQVKPVCLVRELTIPYKFLIYGDMVLEIGALNEDQGIMFSENNWHAELKSCSRVINKYGLIHFDVGSEAKQLTDFQFLSNLIKDISNPQSQELSQQIHKYSERVRSVLQLDQGSNATKKFDDLCNSHPNYSLDYVLNKVQNIIQKALKKTPHLHYQLYRKTANSFGMIRGGLSIEGIKGFGFNSEDVAQSILRKNCLPIERRDQGFKVALRSVKKLNIDYALFAKKNYKMHSSAIMKINQIQYCFQEATKVYSLCDFIDPTSDCNYYLLVHKISFAPVNQSQKQIPNTLSNPYLSSTDEQETRSPSCSIQDISLYPEYEDEYSLDQTLSSRQISEDCLHLCSEFNGQIKQSDRNQINYKRKAKDFVDNFYKSNDNDTKKKEQFDKVLKNMLTKKQKILKVKLI